MPHRNSDRSVDSILTPPSPKFAPSFLLPSHTTSPKWFKHPTFDWLRSPLRFEATSEVGSSDDQTVLTAQFVFYCQHPSHNILPVASISKTINTRFCGSGGRMCPDEAQDVMVRDITSCPLNNTKIYSSHEEAIVCGAPVSGRAHLFVSRTDPCSATGAGVREDDTC